MQERHDSSVWRSLAVAFGDGLAFGVGMKLTQNPGRQAERAVDPARPAGRLEAIEQRLERMERHPASAGPFDQKVLEAVVNALDARLKEQAASVEKRLTALEARIAVELQALHQQDRATASGAEARVEEVQTELERQAAEAAGRLEAEAGAIRGEMAGIEERAVAAAGARFRQLEVQLHDEIRQAAGRAASQVASAADAAVEQKLAPVRADLERATGEIARLRQGLADSDGALMDFVLSVGRICRDAAGGMKPPPPGGESLPQEPAAPPEAPPAPPQHDPAIEGAAVAPSDLADEMLPGFAQPTRQHRPWRIPLVSSILLASGGLLLLRFW
jgi:hypothetical protein